MLSCVTLIAIAVGLAEATVCKVKSECAANECCYIRPQYLIASKRQMVLPGVFDDTLMVDNGAKINPWFDDLHPDRPGIPGYNPGIYSKRQLVLPEQPLSTHDTGMCETYKNPGDPCSVILNGHCGCSSGYSCQWVPEPSTTASAGRRSMIYHPGPGSYQCAANNP